MLRTVFISIIVLSFTLGCKTVKVISENDFQSKIESSFKSNYKTTYNTDNTYILAWSEDSSSGTRVINFSVWERATGKKVYADSVIEGKVEWMSDTELYLEDHKGIVSEGVQINKYKIDINTQRKIKLNGKADA